MSQMSGEDLDSRVSKLAPDNRHPAQNCPKTFESWDQVRELGRAPGSLDRKGCPNCWTFGWILKGDWEQNYFVGSPEQGCQFRFSGSCCRRPSGEKLFFLKPYEISAASVLHHLHIWLMLLLLPSSSSNRRCRSAFPEFWLTFDASSSISQTLNISVHSDFDHTTLSAAKFVRNPDLTFWFDRRKTSAAEADKSSGFWRSKVQAMIWAQLPRSPFAPLLNILDTNNQLESTWNADLYFANYSFKWSKHFILFFIRFLRKHSRKEN